VDRKAKVEERTIGIVDRTNKMHDSRAKVTDWTSSNIWRSS